MGVSGSTIAGLYLVGLTILIQGCAGLVVAGAATGAAIATDRRTTGTMIDDQGVEMKIYDAFYSDPELPEHSHLDVTSFNHIVLLTGETTDEALRQRIEDLAGNVAKVRRVYNEMVVAAPSSMLTRSSDAWLTSKVKSRLLGAKGVNPLHIKVTSENGTVYLMGLVSEKEAHRATEVARQTGGVQRVVKLFEYRS